MSSRISRLGRVWAAIAAVMLLTGCGIFHIPARVDEITPEIIVGAWEAAVDGHTVELRISEDGSLEVENLPIEVLQLSAPSLDWRDAIEYATGTWQLAEPGTDMCCGDPWFWISVQVDPDDPLYRPTTTMFVSGVGSDIQLHLYWNIDTAPPLQFEPVS